MGLCLSAQSDNIKLKDRVIEMSHEIAFLKRDRERYSIDNMALRKKIIEMELKLENYGMVLAGTSCRISPTSYEISRRLGIATV